MITIGFSTRKSNPSFIEHIRKTVGFKNAEIIEVVNDGEKSLTKVYNEILNQAKNDIVVLCHDDLIFETKSWGNEIQKNFKKSDYGIIGLAGGTYMSESGVWWEKPMTMRGIVNHQNEGKTWQSKYSKDYGKIANVALVDGLFIAIDRNRIKHKFDEEFSGFHFYDLSFTTPNYLDGVKIGVTYDVRVTHLSIGVTTPSWEENKKLYVEKYKDKLPYTLDENCDITTFITCHDQDIIKSNIASGKFDSLGKVVFMFVGKGEFTDIENYDNVIIVRDLPYNIEKYPNFTAFTAWYAIMKNKLCNTKYINLLEYDVNLKDNYGFFLKNMLKASDPKIVGYFPLQMSNYHYITNQDWVSSIFNGLLDAYNLDMKAYMNNLMNDAKSKNVELYWPTTNNVCLLTSYFEKYMNWLEPIIPYMMVDQYAGHNQERALSFFSLLTNVPVYFYVGDIEHVQADSHKTQGHEVTKEVVL